MKRKVVAVWVSLLITVSSVVILVKIAPMVEAPATLYVGGSNPGNYSKIQWAIDNATDGDTVFVYNGTYYENVIVDKTITLMGEDRNITLINGSGNGNVLRVTANWVNITGFNISGSGSNVFNAGIRIDSSNNTIYCNNITRNNKYGIYISGSTDNNILDNNIYLNSDIGIFIEYSSYNIIKFNNISLNGVHGIYFSTSTNNVIKNNLILFNNPFMSGSFSLFIYSISI